VNLTSVSYFCCPCLSLLHFCLLTCHLLLSFNFLSLSLSSLSFSFSLSLSLSLSLVFICFVNLHLNLFEFLFLLIMSFFCHSLPLTCLTSSCLFLTCPPMFVLFCLSFCLSFRHQPFGNKCVPIYRLSHYW
jgi:hypothetical protein